MQILVLLGRLRCTQTATTNVSSKWKCSLMFAQQQYLDSIGANLVRPLQGCVQQYGWLQVICNNDVLVLLEPNACRCHPQQPWRPSACSRCPPEWGFTSRSSFCWPLHIFKTIGTVARAACCVVLQRLTSIVAALSCPLTSVPLKFHLSLVQNELCSQNQALASASCLLGGSCGNISILQPLHTTTAFFLRRAIRYTARSGTLPEFCFECSLSFGVSSC